MIRSLKQRFSTGASQEFLTHAIPYHLAGALASFPLDCKIKKMTTAQLEWLSG